MILELVKCGFNSGNALGLADNLHNFGRSTGSCAHSGYCDTNAPHNGTVLNAELFSDRNESGKEGIVVEALNALNSRKSLGKNRLYDIEISDLVLLVEEELLVVLGQGDKERHLLIHLGKFGDSRSEKLKHLVLVDACGDLGLDKGCNKLGELFLVKLVDVLAVEPEKLLVVEYGGRLGNAVDSEYSLELVKGEELGLAVLAGLPIIKVPALTLIISRLTFFASGIFAKKSSSKELAGIKFALRTTGKDWMFSFNSANSG